MALTLNNFWGAETGGMEEASAFSGATVSSFLPHSGGYEYTFTFDTHTVDFDPFESIADAGTGCVLGFWFKTPGTYPLSATNIARLWDGTNDDFILKYGTSGEVLLYDAGGTVRITGTEILSTSTWSFIEAYVERVNSGSAALFVSGIADGTASAQDFNAITGTPVIQISGAVPAGSNYFDDIYFMSGAAAATDRLGGCEVFSYRSSKASAVPDDGGDSLDAGSPSSQWVQTQEIPFSDTNWAAYRAGTGLAGAVSTDDVGGSASTGGPNTDANITGSILAMKSIWRMDRSGGGGTDHYGLMGNSVDGTNRTLDFDPTASAANYFSLWANNWLELSSGLLLAASGSLAADRDRGIVFESDGLTAYVMDSTGEVFQYDVDPAWDVTGMTASGDSYSATEVTVQAIGLAFNPGGTKMYLKGNSTDIVYQYGLTAWDITTASYEGESPATNSNWGFSLSSNGEEFYVGDGGGTWGIVDQWSLSTAWDISSATFTGSGASGNDVIGTTHGVLVHEDGFVLFTGNNIEGIVKWEMSTQWDITTAVITGTLNALTNGIYCLWLNPDGSEIFTARTDNQIRSYVFGGLIPSASEYCQIGFETTGGQDFDCYDMLATVLHVPNAPAALIYNPGKVYQPNLMR